MADILKHPAIDSCSQETTDRIAKRIAADKAIAIQRAEQIAMHLGQLPDEADAKSLKQARYLCQWMLDKLRVLDVESPTGNAELNAIIEKLVIIPYLISDYTRHLRQHPAKQD